MPAQKGIAKMASTFLSLHYHVVFSTKLRKDLIAESWRERLHEYLGGTIKGLGGFTQGIGGTGDHVHLLIGLKSTHTLSDFMRELKKSSSAWVHSEIGLAQFAWQEGYGAFTVGPTSRDGVKKYIANQEEHHRRLTFREELVYLLEQAGIDYQEKWLD
jgi:REP element-mobilizing transposase RayT